MVKVTVLTPTYNRRAYLRHAIRSVLEQEFTDWEMLVINDGGEDVGDIVEGFGDGRIRYFRRPENLGKAACLNFGLERARGRYIAYLDDDDVWYPNHLAVLADTLDRNRHAGAAYSDLYRVLFLKDEQGNRYPLDKRVEVSRDYNRMFMFYFNHVLHVSLMHRKSLALRAGGYDERVRVLIDWDLTRKLSFYTGFLYVPAITGEYYAPVADSDRISDVQREDEERYKENLRRIRADLPPEPWSKVRRVAVIFPVRRWDAGARQMVAYFADKLSYPCRIILVNRDTSRAEGECLGALGSLADLRNLRVVRAPAGADLREAYATGARCQDADYYYLPSERACLDAELRLIRALCYQAETGCSAVRWPEDSGTDGPYDVMLTRGAAGADAVRLEQGDPQHAATIPAGWLPRELRTDYLLHFARKCEADGNYPMAGQLLDRIGTIKHGGAGSPYLAQLYASIAFGLGDYAWAEDVCRQLVAQGYGPDNWVRLGRMCQRKGDHEAAVDAYRHALEGIGLRGEDIESSVFPLACDQDCDAFLAMVGLGECLVETGAFEEAARVLRRASRLRINSYRPNLAFARLFLSTGDLDRAEEALLLAAELADEDGVVAVEVALAETYERRGQLEPAYGRSLRALAGAPEDAEHAERAARLARRLGRNDEAADVYRSFLTYRPGHVPTLLALCRLCLEHGCEQEALELAEKAALLSPGNEEAAAVVASAREPSTIRPGS